MSTPFIDLLHPPGASVFQAPRAPPFHPGSNPAVPPIFLSALSVRFPVFIDEQNCSAEEEIDKDDPISWHWVVYVSVGSKTGKNEDGKVAASTIRLVPVTPLAGHSQAEQAVRDEQTGRALGPKLDATKMWDGKEAFVKLARMATLKEYRKLGLGRLLVNTAIDWLEQNPEKVARESGNADAVAREKDVTGEWHGLVLVHAQKEMERFWANCGFVEDEGMGDWWEEGIKHVAMWRRVKTR